MAVLRNKSTDKVSAPSREGILLRLIKPLEGHPEYLLIFAIALLFSGAVTGGSTAVGIYRGSSTGLFIAFGSLVATLFAAVVVIAILNLRPPDRDGPPPDRGQDPLRALLNFGEDDVFIVFPPRDVVEAILPRVSVEDFLAIRNIQESLRSIDWKRPVRVRDSELFFQIDTDRNRRKNLVIICSPKTNRLAKELFCELATQNRWCPFHFAEDEPGRWHIHRDPKPLKSESYEQEQSARDKRLPVAEQTLNDVAVLAKFNNPWNPANKVLIAAGVRGIGTWGATDHLRKNAADLFQRKQGDKTGEFVAYLDIKYRNFNLVGTNVRYFDQS